MQKKPIGLKIISSDVGAPEDSAAETRNGSKINERKVSNEVLVFNKKCIVPLCLLLYNA